MQDNPMPSSLHFSGRLSRKPYSLLTAAFVGLVLTLAASSGQPVFQLLNAPWMVLGRGLDDLVRLSPGALDGLLSLAVALPLLWLFCALTVRRLRDLGQSPWWTVLVVVSGMTVPIMIVLSVWPSAEVRPIDGRVLSHA